MDEDQIERVANAIDRVQLFSRYNDWTDDRVPGEPVEICRHGADDEEEVVIVARFSKDTREGEALRQAVSRARAIAAINAITS